MFIRLASVLTRLREVSFTMHLALAQEEREKK